MLFNHNEELTRSFDFLTLFSTVELLVQLTFNLKEFLQSRNILPNKNDDTSNLLLLQRVVSDKKTEH